MEPPILLTFFDTLDQLTCGETHLRVSAVKKLFEIILVYGLSAEL